MIQITMQFVDEPCRRLIATGMPPARAGQPAVTRGAITAPQRPTPGPSPTASGQPAVTRGAIAAPQEPPPTAPRRPRG